MNPSHHLQYLGRRYIADLIKDGVSIRKIALRLEWHVVKLPSGGPTARNYRSLGQSAATPQEKGRIELRTLKACLTEADRVHIRAAL